MENYKKQDIEDEKKRLQQIEGPTNFADILCSDTIEEKQSDIISTQEKNKQINELPLKILSNNYEEYEEAGLRINIPVKAAPWDGKFDSSFVEKLDESNERKRRKSEPLNSNKEVFFQI